MRILSDHTLHGSMIINLRLLCKVFRQQNWSFFSERLARFPESLSRASVLVDMKTCWHFWKVGIWRKGCKGQGRYRREFKVIIVDQKLPTTVSESEIFHIYVWIKYKYSELHDLASGVVWEPLKILEQHFKIESLRIELNCHSCSGNPRGPIPNFYQDCLIPAIFLLEGRHLLQFRMRLTLKYWFLR